MSRKEDVSSGTDLTNQEDLEEVSKIVPILSTYEKVLLVVKQSPVKSDISHLAPNIVFATDRRIIIRDPRVLGIHESIVDIPYDTISSVKLEKDELSPSANLMFRMQGLINLSDVDIPTENNDEREVQVGTIEAVPKDKAQYLLEIITQRILQKTNSILQVKDYISKHFERFQWAPYILGRCNICGNYTAFYCYYNLVITFRESLVCAECLTTSRYRSIARGILQAISELRGFEAESIDELSSTLVYKSLSKDLKIFDTQVPFFYKTNAYPIPQLLSKCRWMDVQTSTYQPQKPWGIELGMNSTNQNLEQLTFSDNSFDIVITSDVMEHVRLDDRAHREIRRVLKPGGFYVFTVPYLKDIYKTFVRMVVSDPSDPSSDRFVDNELQYYDDKANSEASGGGGKAISYRNWRRFISEELYHGDANSEGGKALSYRTYGRDLKRYLGELGFIVEYCEQDFPEMGIINTELFFCRLSK